MTDRNKMRLEDLQPQAQDPIDWNSLDQFFNVDAPQALGKTLLLTRLIEQLGVLNIEQVNNQTVISYLSKMATDTQQMSASLSNLVAQYNTNKQLYQGKYDENAHMFSLSISFSMQEWLEQYESTIAQSIEDVVNYINSVVPQEQSINIQ